MPDLDAGQPPAEAVRLAMHEIVAPVVGSTLTTVVVFVPLGMLSGVVGQFFKALSITLSAAVLISLVQALTLIPLLARWAAKRRERTAADGGPHPHTAGALERGYSWTLDSTMRRPTGSSPGKYRAAKASFTTATGGAPGPSKRPNSLPRTRGTPSVRKYPGLTGRYDASS